MLSFNSENLNSSAIFCALKKMMMENINEVILRVINVTEYISDLDLVSFASMKNFMKEVSIPNIYITPKKRDSDCINVKSPICSGEKNFV